jgi:heterodisulfide reductase subunit A
MERIGVYVCHCGTNIAGKIDVESAAEFARTLPGVVLARDNKFMCSDPGQEQIVSDIREHDLDRVVVAACSPLMHENTFRNVAERAGLNPYLVQIANIREQSTWVTEDGDQAALKAHAHIAAAVAKARYLEPLERKHVPIHPVTLIVGGGIAGIQAALEMADAGQQVVLVERSPSIGGHMAQFDKTFPTLDCSACILTPKMTRVGQHPNIRLLTYSEVEQVDGYIGNFEVKVRRKAAYIDHEKCTGCGVCTEKCPIKVPNEFDMGLSMRRVAYTPFAQAVPNKPVIDPDRCVYFKNGKCRFCERVCEADAICWEQEDVVETIQCGNVIVATGYELMDNEPLRRQYGHGHYPEVYTGLELERLLNAAGPTEGKVVTKDGRTPEAVAILHCIGSRDRRYHEYCSRVCCMLGVKYAHLIKERTGAEVFNCYIDLRCFGKAFEEFYRRTQEERVRFVRGKAAYVTDVAMNLEERGKLIVGVDDTLQSRFLRIPVDMVVLMTALVPRADTDDVRRLFNLCSSADGFFMEKHPKMAPVQTAMDGVLIAGCCQGPKDIPDTVAQASAAAARALATVGAGQVVVESATAVVDEDACSGCKSCLPLCPYSAISFSLSSGTSQINDALCKGCGTCAASCPSAAITARHFTDTQVFAEIQGALSV